MVSMLLKTSKGALNGAKLKFQGNVSGHLNDFTDHSMLLSHIEKELLPIASACHSYNFGIDLRSDNSAEANIFAAILQFEPVAVCSNVLFELYLGRQTELSVEPILNWLNRSRNYSVINANGPTNNERSLEIQTDEYISNVSEVQNGFKTVKFKLYIYLFDDIKNNEKKFAFFLYCVFIAFLQKEGKFAVRPTPTSLNRHFLVLSLSVRLNLSMVHLGPTRLRKLILSLSLNLKAKTNIWAPR